MPESFYIETFGCQMNKADSELMALSLVKNGFVQAPSGAEADILLFNTCSVRLHAENRALARLRAARSAGRGGKPSLLVAAGCMAQRMGENLLEEDLVDLAVGPYQSPSVGDIIQSFRSGLTGRVHLSQQRADFHTRIDTAGVALPETAPWHRWVTITHGCENFCSYCIVPYVRGPLISFKSADILEYIRRCADNGAREITLLGQNVNQYGRDNGDIPFYRLLEKAAAVPGLVRISFLTSHPMDFTTDIVDVIADHGNISRSIHLPLQSGSDEILKKMNRRYTMAEYMKTAVYIRSRLENHSLSTDLIVGFPGETGADYGRTLEAVREIRFDEAYMYAYSPRSGTAAAALTEGLTAREKQERLGQLIDVQREISREKLISRIDRTEEIIVEGFSRRSRREVIGRSFLNHPVIVPGDTHDFGKKITITVRGIRGSTLYGERIA